LCSFSANIKIFINELVYFNYKLIIDERQCHNIVNLLEEMTHFVL